MVANPDQTFIWTTPSGQTLHSQRQHAPPWSWLNYSYAGSVFSDPAMTTTSARFDPAVARALPGPEWLRVRREAAAELASGLELPTTDEEVWRYSRVDDLDLEAYVWPTGESTEAGVSVPAGARSVVEGVSERAGSVIVVDGRVARIELDPAWASRGVTLGRLADHPDGAALAGRVDASDAADLFGALNQALSDPVALVVPPGVQVDKPVVVVDWHSQDRAVTFPRLLVSLGDDAAATVVDHHGGEDVAGLVVPVIELDVGPAARLGYLNVQQRGPQTWQIASQVSRVERRGHPRGGPGRARRRLRPHPDRLPPGRARRHRQPAGRVLRRGRPDARLPHLPGPRRPRHHLATCCSRGRSAAQSRSVYTGLIRVRQEGPRHQRLPDQPQPSSCPTTPGPSRCPTSRSRTTTSTAATPRPSGPIDEEQRFYLESRGVPTAGGRAAGRRRLLRRGARRSCPVPDVGAPVAARPAVGRARSTRERSHRSMTGRARVLGRRCGRRATAAPVRGRRPAPGAPWCASTTTVYAIGDRCTPRRTSRCPRARSTPTTREIECWKHGSMLLAGHRRAAARCRPPGRSRSTRSRVDGDDVDVVDVTRWRRGS